jgi:magnesium-dependent phosphatase-1
MKMIESPWVVFLDLDGTLWDHLDITAASPPFTRISESIISDSLGVRISLLPGAVDFIKWVRSSGGIISTCSWNEYDKAIGALEAYGIVHLFDYQKVSTNPKKYLLMEEVISKLVQKGVSVRMDRLFYLDDRDIHISDVKVRFPELTFFLMWKNGTNYESVKSTILSKIKGTQ